MKTTALQKAINDAKRFARLGEDLLKRQYSEKFLSHNGETMQGRETAAIKRASLDLSNALADMRANRHAGELPK